MKNELTVNINICDRVYPMKVLAADEASVRNAGKLVNERVRAYKEQFGIGDKQDLLAMVSFDCTIDNLRKKEERCMEEHKITEEIESLTQSINQVLTNH